MRLRPLLSWSRLRCSIFFSACRRVYPDISATHHHTAANPNGDNTNHQGQVATGIQPKYLATTNNNPNASKYITTPF